MTPEERAGAILRALTRNVHHVIAAIYDNEEAESIVAYEVERILAEEREACAQIAERGPASLMEENDGTTYANAIAAEIRART